MQSNPQFHREAQIIYWLQFIFIVSFFWLMGLLIGADERYLDNSTQLFTTLGFFLGIGEWLAMRRRSKIGSWWGLFVWVGLTTLGAFLGEFLAGTLANVFSDQFVTSAYSNPFMGMIYFGALGIMFGLGVSLCQWVFLTFLREPNPHYWILANIAGWGLGQQLGSVIPHPVVSLMVSAVIAGIIMGLWAIQLLAYE